MDDIFRVTRVRGLTERAAQAGYHLVCEAHSSVSWILLDNEDGERIHSAKTLDQIERILSE